MAKLQTVPSPDAMAQVYRMLAQMRATGRVLTPRDVESAYRAALDTEASKAMQRHQLNMQQQQWQKNYNLQRQQYEDRKEASKMTGIGSLGMMAYQFGNPLMRGAKRLFGIQDAVVPQQGGGGFNYGFGSSPNLENQGVGTPVPAIGSSASSVSTGTGAGGFWDNVGDYAMPAVIGSGLGYGVSEMTDNPWLGVAAGVGGGLLADYFQQGDNSLVSQAIDGLTEGIGGLFG